MHTEPGSYPVQSPVPWHLPRLFPILLTACLLSFSTPAVATQVTIHEVPCPLDGASTRVFEKLSSDSRGGFDSDLCSYSSHGQWREYSLATCPEDLFTLLGDEFDQVRDESTTARLKALADQVRSQYPDFDKIEVWDRYEIAARFYRLLGRDDAFIGQLYLAASWTARDQAVGVYEGLEGPQMAYQLLELGAQELQKDLSAEQRKTVTYNLARVAQRAGENALRDQYLSLFEAQGDLTDKEREALDRFRLMVTEVEPRYQDMAIAAYSNYLHIPNLPHEPLVRVTYQLADLLRRRGRLREALPQYTLVANDTRAPQNLREMALFLANHIVDRVESQDSH